MCLQDSQFTTWKPHSKVTETVEETDDSSSIATSKSQGDVITKQEEELVKATKELYKDVIKKMPSRHKIPYRDMMADEISVNNITTSSGAVAGG